MTGWAEFALAIAVFLGAHVIPARPATRAWLIARLGRGGYIAGFSLLSLLLLYWLIVAAGRAPVIILWDHAGWQRWLVNLAMPVAVALAAFAPGMSGLIRAFTVWAGAHVIANGDLAHAILFGAMLGFAVIGLMRGRQPVWRFTLLRAVVAVAVWAALFALHPYVIGVSPAP